MVTIPKWVVYDIVLPTLFPMIGQDSFKQIFSKCLEVTSAPEETLGTRINKSHGQSYPSRGFVDFFVFADCELKHLMCILCVYYGQSLVVHKKIICCCLWLFSIYLVKL